MLTQPLTPDVIFSSQRKNDERLGNFVVALPRMNTPKEINSLLQKRKNPFLIAGYPDDEGIQLNNGLIGAAKGPDSIRKFFYKMTPQTLPPRFSLLDLGNIATAGQLIERHNLAKTLATQALKSQCRWIGLGGGHDYAYADGAAFLSLYKNSKQKPLILNFDAHLDVRLLDRGFNSGTAFRRLLEEFDNFDLAYVGIQKLCNNPNYIEWAQKKKVKIIWNEELTLNSSGVLKLFVKRLKPWLKHGRPTFLSVDIDGFSSSFAPGCSQSWPTGFSPQDFFKIFNFILKTLDTKVLGIYEVSPPLDVQNQTAKLAAEIIYGFVHGY